MTDQMSDGTWTGPRPAAGETVSVGVAAVGLVTGSPSPTDDPASPGRTAARHARPGSLSPTAALRRLRRRRPGPAHRLPPGP